MHNAEMVSAFLCSDSRVANGVIKSSKYAGSCECISFSGSPGSRLLLSFTFTCDNATSSMTMNTCHANVFFLSFFTYALMCVWVFSHDCLCLRDSRLYILIVLVSSEIVWRLFWIMSHRLIACPNTAWIYRILSIMLSLALLGREGVKLSIPSWSAELRFI